MRHEVGDLLERGWRVVGYLLVVGRAPVYLLFSRNRGVIVRAFVVEGRVYPVETAS